MQYVQVRRLNKDTNGNSRWLYTFVDTTAPMPLGELQGLFNFFGRKSKKGIITTMPPAQVKQMIQSNTLYYDDLGRIQKAIDRCNGKRGCKGCSGENRTGGAYNCHLLREHTDAVALSRYRQEMLTNALRDWRLISDEPTKIGKINIGG